MPFCGRSPVCKVLLDAVFIARWEDTMRLLTFILVTLVLGVAPASAWEEYTYLDRGFAIQFPAKPVVTAGNYPSILFKGLTASIYTAEDDHVLYRMTVVDLAGHNEAGANFLNEAAYNLMREGDVLFTDFPRIYQNEKSIFGVTLVVDRPDGNRVRTSVYYNKGRLYLADAIVTPARGDKDMTTPSRFDQTVRFPPDGRFD
jgi:hypothetical protein